MTFVMGHGGLEQLSWVATSMRRTYSTMRSVCWTMWVTGKSCRCIQVSATKLQRIEALPGLRKRLETVLAFHGIDDCLLLDANSDGGDNGDPVPARKRLQENQYRIYSL